MANGISQANSAMMGNSLVGQNHPMTSANRNINTQGQNPAKQKTPAIQAAGNTTQQTVSPLAQPKADTVTILGKQIKKKTLFAGLTLAVLAIGATVFSRVHKTPNCVKKAISEAEGLQTTAKEMQKIREDFINSFNQKHSSIQRIFDDGDKPLENGKFKVKIEDIPDGIGKKMNEYAEDGETIIRTSQFYPDSDNKKFSLSTFTEFLENSKQNMYSITSAEQGTKFTYEEGIEAIVDKEGKKYGNKAERGFELFLDNGKTMYYENRQTINQVQHHYEKTYQNLPNTKAYYQEGISSVPNQTNIEKQIQMSGDNLYSYSSNIEFRNETTITGANLLFKNGEPECYNKILVATPGRDAKAEKTLRKTPEDKWAKTAY